MVGAIRRELKARDKQAGPTGEEARPELSARFQGLVDLVLDDGQVKYLVKRGDEVEVEAEWADEETGAILQTPPLEAIPYPLARAEEVLQRKAATAGETYGQVLALLHRAAVLPEEGWYHPCVVFVFFSHLTEMADYFPYLWFFGLPERGKARVVKAMCRLCWRGFYTETLNEANLFRFAELFGGTIALDLYEISQRAQKKGGQDLLLGRFEKGMKVARVIAPDQRRFKDTVYYRVDGPTLLATNKEILASDPLRSKCLKITMPEARGIYSNLDPEELERVRLKLLACRAAYLNQDLPWVEKPSPGRLGDLMQPLFRVARLLPPEAEANLGGLIELIEAERGEAEAETMAGRIGQALASLKGKVKNGLLPVDKSRSVLNEGLDECWRLSAQRLGRELNEMGIRRRKSQGRMHIEWTANLDRVLDRFGPGQETSPSSPVSLKAGHLAEAA